MTLPPVLPQAFRTNLDKVGFSISDLLGGGAWGHVWLGTELKTTKRVAIKVPRLHDNAQRLALAIHQFENEFHKLRELPIHANLVNLLYIGTSGPLPFLVYEYCSSTLKAMLASSPAPHRLEPTEVMRLAQDVLSGLHVAHNCRKTAIIHKDLHPGNIFQAPDGTYKVGDFGLARTVILTDEGDVEPQSSDIEHVAGIGFLKYMPPEHPTLEPCPGFDLFSLGLVLLECLTGKDWGPRYTWNCNQLKQELRRVSGDVESRFYSALCRALDHNPATRIQSDSEFTTLLDSGRSFSEAGFHSSLLTTDYPVSLIQYSNSSAHSRLVSSAGGIGAITKRLRKLNQAFEGRAAIGAILTDDPIVSSCGTYPMDASLSGATAAQEAECVAKGKPNECHGIVSKIWVRDSVPAEISYRELKYSAMRALEHRGEKVSGLYAGAVVCCPQLHVLYVHRRSDKVDLFPNLLHTMSGNFKARAHLDPDKTLNDTARREILEEMSVRIEPAAQLQPTALIHETTSARILVHFLGVGISHAEANCIRPSEEGRVVPIQFNSITELLSPDQWAPSGLLNVLTWLAIGAPIGNGSGIPDSTKVVDKWLRTHATS